LSVDKHILEKDKKVHDEMKRTTFKIGHEPPFARTAVVSSHNLHFNKRIFEDPEAIKVDVSRRCDP
jgi:hypothetical protein